MKPYANPTDKPHVLTIPISDRPGSAYQVPTYVRQRLWLWREQRRQRSQPRASLTVIEDVTRSMALLNRYAHRAGHRPYRDFIYRVKREYLYLLYMYGHLVRVQPKQQTLKCHSCDGSGWVERGGQDYPCWRCEDGVWKRILVLEFVVSANGCRFSFHQPADLAPWALDLVAPEDFAAEVSDLPVYTSSDPEQATMPLPLVQQHLARVLVLISRRRWFAPVAVSPLSACLAADARRICAAVRYAFLRRWWRIEHFVLVAIGLEEELPF